jgi:hypothetical protein
MFSIADLVVVAGLKDALDFYSKNPKHIEFILGQFCQKPISNIVGQEHIKLAIETIQSQRIEVAPYYQLDQKRRPSIAVVASYTESQQFIGDYGRDEIDHTLTLPAKKYASFDALAINGNKINVSNGLNLDKILWLGLFVSNGIEVAKLTGIYKKESVTELFLDKELPKETRLSGWGVYSSAFEKGYVINSSTEDVSIQCNFQTIGDYSVHRLMATVIRACLKKQRLWFDQYGLQVSTFAQTPPILSSEDETEFQTVFTINGKTTDSWISKEFDLPNEASNILIELIAQSKNPKNEEVVLG